MPEKKQKLSEVLKNLGMLPQFFLLYFEHLRLKVRLPARIKPKIFVNFRSEPTLKARPDLQPCCGNPLWFSLLTLCYRAFFEILIPTIDQFLKISISGKETKLNWLMSKIKSTA